LCLIFAGAYFGNRLPSHLAEMAVTMAGSCCMIAGHFLNHTFCRNCERCDAACSPPALIGRECRDKQDTR
jgi:hypothetical protein